MQNPFDAVKNKIEEIQETVRVQVQIDLLREGVSLGLSRLITLDPKNAIFYQSALKSLG